VVYGPDVKVKGRWHRGLEGVSVMNNGVTPYSLKTLEADILTIVRGLANMRAAKGHDYSGTIDTLENLREFGSFGVLVRIGDKFKRLKHFFKTSHPFAVESETLMDTVNDLINYSLFLRILIDHECERGRDCGGVYEEESEGETK